MTDSVLEAPQHGWLLPSLEGSERDEAIAEYVAREQPRRGDSKARNLASPKREKLVRGATRRRLVRKARRGQWDERYYDYYAGVPHVQTATVKRSVRRAYSFKLVVTATTNGVHSATSLHKVKRAADYGNIVGILGTPEQRRRLVEFQLAEYSAWRRGDRPHLQELIGPDNNAVVLRGRHCPLVEGSDLEQAHDNHVHEGFWS